MAVLASPEFNKVLQTAPNSLPNGEKTQLQIVRGFCMQTNPSERVPQSLFPHSQPVPVTPVLPPRLQEHERMEFVRQWVNRIPDTCSSSSSSGAPPRSPPTSTSSHSYLHESFYASMTTRTPADVTSGAKGGFQITNTRGSVNRMFSVSEMETIVRCFLQFLQTKKVPSLGEVRSLLADNALMDNRNPVSIRNKVKRLLVDDKWRDYLS